MLLSKGLLCSLQWPQRIPLRSSHMTCFLGPLWMDSQLICHCQHWCGAPLPALVCSVLQGRIRLSQAARAHRLQQPPLSVLCVPSTGLPFRPCSGSGDKREDQNRGHRDMGAGCGENRLSRMWSLAWEPGGLGLRPHWTISQPWDDGQLT